MMAKMFYTLDEAKSALGRNEEEIKQLAREGRLREFRDGPRLMFKADQVEQLKSELGGGGAGGRDHIDLGPSDSGAPIGLVDSRNPGASGSGISLVDSDMGRSPGACMLHATSAAGGCRVVPGPPRAAIPTSAPSGFFTRRPNLPVPALVRSGTGPISQVPSEATVVAGCWPIILPYESQYSTVGMPPAVLIPEPFTVIDVGGAVLSINAGLALKKMNESSVQ